MFLIGNIPGNPITALEFYQVVIDFAQNMENIDFHFSL